MADTDTETLPNGTGGALSTEEEDERLKQRPADIDADVREMERRKRVEALMSSKLFREELERVLDQQMHEGSDAPLLQRIREMVGGRLHTGSVRGPACVLPINDIRGLEGIGYEKGEKILRCKLAAVYRLVDLFGWTQTGITGQITARLNTAVEQFLTAPRGLLPHEVTASSLVKVDMLGTVQDQGTTNLPVNVEGFSLHACVHAARPDVRCVLHVRSASVLAVSSTVRGLLPLCHEAALLGPIATLRAPTGLLDNSERDKLVRALGPSARVLMLASGGALCCGATLEEAFHQARHLTAACDVQLRLAGLPQDELLLIDEETRNKIYESSRKPPADATKWRVGGEEFEALMRMLDNAGFRTGYIYRHPLIKNDVPRPKNDVEVPPAVSSLGYLLEEEELYKQGLWKKGQGKTGERTRWLNSPNVYQKVEVLETGTNDPKKITKWVQDGSPAHSSTPVKIDTLQFVPKNTNPKEFKALQQQIKENRRADKISAGPQSHILEGVTWDEASKLVGEDAANTHTGDHVVLMGAASKGIIQRGYQHNATMYSAPYARNPFDHISDREIEEYRRTVERKARSDYDTDLSESEAISAAQITSPASAPSETEEESRDEHRVLRIETKQAPVRSQPEVVLSDDTVDFLNMERAHADRTKGNIPRSLHDVLTSNKRSVHDYPRSVKLENIVQKYDSCAVDRIHPKCKLSLNNRLKANDNHKIAETQNAALMSSRSSLYSIPSIEWDGRCKSEYNLRTRSLPRQKNYRNDSVKLYRTRSHSGFINSYVKDPQPIHYHLPRCRSCGATNNSYAWELAKNRKTIDYSLYLSADNIAQKCIEDVQSKPVKVQQKLLPEMKLAKVENEFVESQEFNEDNYLEDIGNSFSPANQTVIVKPGHGNVESLAVTEAVAKEPLISGIKIDNKDVHRAICVRIGTEKGDDNNNFVESVEGEYHSFIEEMDFEQAIYESPVKDLVEKDIRDYSVPIDFYCEDYSKKDDCPTISPQKRREISKSNILEPILEESKSSNDDFNNSNDNKDKITVNLYCASIVQNIIDRTTSTVELKSEVEHSKHTKVTSEFLESECISKNKYFIEDKESEVTNNDSASPTVQPVLDVYKEITDQTEEQVVNYVYEDIVEILSQDASIVDSKAHLSGTKEIRSSLYSVSSGSEVVSFDSTIEFEKYEAISELIASILNKIDFNEKGNNFFRVLENRAIDTQFDIGSNIISTFDEHPDSNIVLDTKSSKNTKLDDYMSEPFSIKEIIDDIETNIYNLNETVLTEASECETTWTLKIAESIVYYIFDAACFACTRKNKIKKNCKVVTVVDNEDILFTATSLWNEGSITENILEAKSINVVDNKSEDIAFSKDSNNEECKTAESCLTNTYKVKESLICEFNENEGTPSDHFENFDSNISHITECDAVCDNRVNSFDETYVQERFFTNADEVRDDDLQESNKIDISVYNINVSNYNEEMSVDYNDNIICVNDFVKYVNDTDEINTDIDSSDVNYHSNDFNNLSSHSAENVNRATNINNVLNETFVLETKRTDMNTAFLEDINSRSSSPNNISAFESCVESPIKNSDTSFMGDDLSVFYEKDVTLLGSPFVKKAPVISMSQTVNSGGIKYWLSFDDSLTEDDRSNVAKTNKKFDENKLPSFVNISLRYNDDKTNDDFKPNSILQEGFDDSNINTDSFMSACASTDYATCYSKSIDTPQKRLLYDSRIDTKPLIRKYSSWPPFDDTLFYRIISKFRMSESFDPSNLETSRLDTSF